MFLAIIDADWLERTRQLDFPLDPVRIAIEEAFQQRKEIMPVLVGQVAMPHPATLPEAIQPLARNKYMRVSLENFGIDAYDLVTALWRIVNDAGVEPNVGADPVAPASASDEAQAPDIPEQGHGPHFEIGDDGIVTLAPPAALDRQGNNIDRLKRMHPELRDLSRELAEALGKGNIPHVYLLDRAKAYHRQIDHDLDRIDFSLLYMAGVRLANAEKAAAGDRELPPLAVPVRETIESLLRFHGTFMLATREGLEAIAAEERYRRTQHEEIEYRKAAIDFARSLQSRPAVVDATAASVVMNAAKEIGEGANLERSGTVATGAIKNIAITIAASAAIGAIPVAAVAIGSTVLAALTGPACLIGTEGLKKSKSFSALAALIGQGIDKVARADLSDAIARVHELFAPQVKFLLSTKEQLARLAGHSDDFKWLTKTVRWVEVGAKQRAALRSTDPPRPPAREPPPPPPPSNPSQLNNIYLGRISVVVPELQAAFVDYGVDRHGFLPFNEIHPDYYQIPVAEKQRLIDEEPLLLDSEDDSAQVISAADDHRYKIQDVIERGQVVLVQITKEPRDNRGAALTTNLSLAGRFLVLMPNHAGVTAVSNNILGLEERERLMAIVQRLPVPGGMSIILREVGASRSEVAIKSDLVDLVARWEALRDLSSKSNPPTRVYDASTHDPARAPDTL